MRHPLLTVLLALSLLPVMAAQAEQPSFAKYTTLETVGSGFLRMHLAQESRFLTITVDSDSPGPFAILLSGPSRFNRAMGSDIQEYPYCCDLLPGTYNVYLVAPPDTNTAFRLDLRGLSGERTLEAAPADGKGFRLREFLDPGLPLPYRPPAAFTRGATEVEHVRGLFLFHQWTLGGIGNHPGQGAFAEVLWHGFRSDHESVECRPYTFVAAGWSQVQTSGFSLTLGTPGTWEFATDLVAPGTYNLRHHVAYGFVIPLVESDPLHGYQNPFWNQSHLQVVPDEAMQVIHDGVCTVAPLPLP